MSVKPLSLTLSFSLSLSLIPLLIYITRTHTHTHTHTHTLGLIFTYIHTHTHTITCLCSSTSIFTHIHTHTHTHLTITKAASPCPKHLSTAMGKETNEQTSHDHPNKQPMKMERTLLVLKQIMMCLHMLPLKITWHCAHVSIAFLSLITQS